MKQLLAGECHVFAGTFSFFLPRLFESVLVNGINKCRNDLGLYHHSDDALFAYSRPFP